MTVRKNERKPSKMEVQNKAYELAAHTIQMAGNESVVPKHHRWAMGNHLFKIAMSIAEHIDMANSLDLFVPSEREQRSLEQSLALAKMFSLRTAIHTAHELSKFDDEKQKHWIGLVLEVQKLLKGWRESDRQRVENFQNGHSL